MGACLAGAAPRIMLSSDARQISPISFEGAAAGDCRIDVLSRAGGFTTTRLLRALAARDVRYFSARAWLKNKLLLPPRRVRSCGARSFFFLVAVLFS